MKTKLKIYGHDYIIEIKAKDMRNLNVSKKATEKFLNWFERRLWEAARSNEEVYGETTELAEITDNAIAIHVTNKKINN